MAQKLDNVGSSEMSILYTSLNHKFVTLESHLHAMYFAYDAGTVICDCRVRPFIRLDSGYGSPQYLKNEDAP